VSPALAERPHISTIKAMPTLEFLNVILGLWMVGNSTWAKVMLRECPGTIQLSDIEHEQLIMTMQLQASRSWEIAFQLRGQASCSRKEARELLEGFFAFLGELGVLVVSYKASGDIVDPQDMTELAGSTEQPEEQNSSTSECTNISPPDDTLDGPATRRVRPTQPSDGGGAGEEALSEPSDSDDPSDVTEDSPSEPSGPARNVGIATPRTNAFVWPHVMISSAQVLAGLAIAFVRTTTSSPRSIDPSFTEDFKPSPSHLLSLDKNNPVETVNSDTCSPSCQEDKPSRKSPPLDDPQVDMTISFKEGRSANTIHTDNAETQVFATNLAEGSQFSLEGSFLSVVDVITQLFSPTLDPTCLQQVDPVTTAKNISYLFSEPVNKIFLAQNFRISMVDRWGTGSIASSEKGKLPLPSTYAHNLPEIVTIIPVPVESKSALSINNVLFLSTEKSKDRPLDNHSPITDKDVKLELSIDLALIVPDRPIAPKDDVDRRPSEENSVDYFSMDAESRSPMKIDLSKNGETHIVVFFGMNYTQIQLEKDFRPKTSSDQIRVHSSSEPSWAREWLSIMDCGFSIDSLNGEYAKQLSQAETYKKPQGVKYLSATEISGFTGVGRGSSPSSSRLSEIDTLQFIGAGLTARYLQMEQQNQDVAITFEGNELTKVTLKNINLDEIDNLDPSTGASLNVGNIIFDGDGSIKDNFDVFNSDWYRNTLQLS
jgi:hypothetical protein